MVNGFVGHAGRLAVRAVEHEDARRRDVVHRVVRDERGARGAAAHGVAHELHRELRAVVGRRARHLLHVGAGRGQQRREHEGVKGKAFHICLYCVYCFFRVVELGCVCLPPRVVSCGGWRRPAGKGHGFSVFFGRPSPRPLWVCRRVAAGFHRFVSGRRRGSPSLCCSSCFLKETPRAGHRPARGVVCALPFREGQVRRVCV